MRTKDLSGQIFGKWKVLYQTDDYVSLNGQHQPMWMCECQCEKHTQKIINGYSLKRGDSKSCGCYFDERVKFINKKYNNFDLINSGYYVGHTQSGEEFYFDEEDYNLISQYCWSIDKSNGYVKTIINGKKVYLHRLVMHCKENDGVTVDHINRKRFDCRKSNLRIVTRCQNNMNAGTRNDNKSGCRGVYFNKTNQKWEVRITVNKSTIWLGSYELYDDAVKVRKQAEEKYFGVYNAI